MMAIGLGGAVAGGIASWQWKNTADRLRVERDDFKVRYDECLGREVEKEKNLKIVRTDYKESLEFNFKDRKTIRGLAAEVNRYREKLGLAPDMESLVLAEDMERVLDAKRIRATLDAIHETKAE